VLRTIKMNVVNTTADYIDFYLRNGYKAERVVFQFRADDGRTVRFEDVPTFTHRGAAQETKAGCGACDKPGEHCSNIHGICSRHGGRPHETAAPPQNGRKVYCSNCDAVAVLSYTDETRRYLDITPLDGWTAPPSKCPKCSTESEEGSHDKHTSA
jgi:hypothetical protein